MVRWAGLFLLMLGGCMGMEEYYLEPYAAPEPQDQVARCGCQNGSTVGQTAPPPLAQNRVAMPQTSLPPIVQTSGSLPIIRTTAEPPVSPPPVVSSTGWTPR